MLVVSPESMRQSDNIIVLGSGASLDMTKNIVKKWHTSKGATVIGTHYRYFLPSDYTIFDAPGKFRDAINHGLQGRFLVTDRIKSIPKKHIKRCMRIKHGPVALDSWKEDDFFIKSCKIPVGGPAWEGVFIASFCRPKNLLIAGVDGHTIVKGKFVLEHASKSTVKYAVKHRKRIQLIKSHRGMYILREKIRKKLTPLIFRYFIEQLGINIHVCEKCHLHGVDKRELENMGVRILR